MKRSLLLSAAIAVLSFGSVQATPILQLYLEGGTYNETTESWDLYGDSFSLWTIGDTSFGTIEDVHLSIVYDSLYSPTFSLLPTTTEGFGGVIDPSTPTGTGTWIQTVTDGSAPLLGDGSSLPTHGIYEDDMIWQEFDLGDFSLSDSPVGDYVAPFPASFPDHDGQINVYDIRISGDGLEGLSFHFDLYDHVTAGNHINYKFAPFSHDADGFTTIVTPEPATIAMMSMGLGAAMAFTKRRRKSRGPGNVPTDDEITEAIDER